MGIMPPECGKMLEFLGPENFPHGLGSWQFLFSCRLKCFEKDRSGGLNEEVSIDSCLRSIFVGWLFWIDVWTGSDIISRKGHRRKLTPFCTKDTSMIFGCSESPLKLWRDFCCFPFRKSDSSISMLDTFLGAQIHESKPEP